MSKKNLFNDNWEFSKQPLGTLLTSTEAKDCKWDKVDLPHDWLIFNTEDLYETGEGWYRKYVKLKKNSEERISICFEGIYMNSTIYVNEIMVGEWKYGYSTFEYDITDALRQGENEIKVRVVHEAPNSRWYSGAGIYRNVWLKTTPLQHLVTDGIYLSTRQENDQWRVLLQTEAINESEHLVEESSVRHTIMDHEGKVVAITEQTIKLMNAVGFDHQELIVERVTRWDIEDPYLYSMKTELIIDGKTVDEEILRFGFRTVRVDQNTGFYLNDRSIKLHGACEHHDLGSLGAAVNRVALRRQLSTLLEMGINAIRTSHNMPSVEMMELADEMGILIVSEAFDMWERSKTEFDYARFFPEWHEKDVASWIRRDRNHPSIIMWSIGNEIYDTHADSRGLELTRELRGLVLHHDPLQNGLDTIGSNYMPWENAQKCAEEVIVAGYNYGEWLYEDHHKKYPHWVIYGSETASTVQSRGIYHFPVDKVVVTHEDEQCSSLDNCTTNWGAKNAQKNITDDRDAKYCLGQFIWTGFDYIGEPTPYATKNSYFGHIDTAGFRKDSAYLYEAEWTDYRTNPMVHLLPYWDFNEGQLIDLRVYSNASKVELFLGDESFGACEIDHASGKKLSGDWRLPYKQGVLKAVAYDEYGQVIATDCKKSFGDAKQLVLEPDKYEMKADGLDLIFVTISAIDEQGVEVANANNRVEVMVSGAGRLVGLDNGDSTDYDQYKGTSRKLFSGKLLAIIAAKQEPGDIHVEVSSVGLAKAELILKAYPCEKLIGVSALMENQRSKPNYEIPIRKIELTNHGSSCLNKEVHTAKITARLLPANTTYTDIAWRVVTPGGIETNIAQVESEGLEALVTALGNGEFRLRCTANNGKRSPEIISEFEFNIDGMGVATVNPYEFVYAGLYNSSNTDLSGGLLNGVSTKEFVESHIGFRGLDFGEYGSDEVTIPIFFNDNVPLEVELWEGIPTDPQAKLLRKAIYQEKPNWGYYIPNTFKLPRRLKGITTFCIVLNRRLNIKGFQFKKPEKAYEQLFALENNNIYGDTFRRAEEAIENIGNNVTVAFDNMDFGEEGFRKLIICGRSHTEKNTIHVRFQSDEGSVNQIADFEYSEVYVVKEFELTSVQGKRQVNFIFLPGSDFDFKWFRFVK
jgi:beta-galactosidase